MTKCLLCLKLVEATQQLQEAEEEYNLEKLSKSITEYCFHWVSVADLPRASFQEGLRHASFCSTCYDKLVELNQISENLNQIEQHLNQLVTSVENRIIESYKDYEDEKGLISSVAKLRIKFHELGMHEEQNQMFHSKNARLSIWVSSSVNNKDAGTGQDIHETWTESDSKNQQTESSSIKRKSRIGRTGRKRLKLDKRFQDPKLKEPQPLLSIPKIDVKDFEFLRPRKSTRLQGTLRRYNDSDTNIIEDEEYQKDERMEIEEKKLRYSKSNKLRLRCTYSGCNKVFKREASRYSHIRHDHDEGVKKQFPCEKCDAVLRTQNGLLRHRKSHDNPKVENDVPSMFPCTYADCAKSFSSESTRFVHVKKFHEGLNTYKCSYCDKTYDKPAKLLVHERIHTGELPFECSTCKKRFSAKSYLNQHMSLHLNKYSCEICGKPSTSRLALKFHMGTHTASKFFVCEICGHSFTTKQYLETHQANTHPQETGRESIKCRICERTLSSKKSLENHLFSIHKIGEAKFQCEYCEAQWNSMRELKMHTNNVHLELKQHECMLCHKKYSTQANLRSHHERHHMSKSERPRPFSCSFCGKSFFAKRTMENHMALHSDERPFPCHLCEQRFPTRSYLDLHKYTIHENRRNKKKPQSQKSNEIETFPPIIENIANTEEQHSHFIDQSHMIG